MNDLFRQLDRSPVTRRKAVWATEFAYEKMPAERKNGVSFANQANYMADAMGIAAKTKRVPLFIWYVMTDPARRPTGSRAC